MILSVDRTALQRLDGLSFHLSNLIADKRRHMCRQPLTTICTDPYT